MEYTYNKNEIPLINLENLIDIQHINITIQGKFVDILQKIYTNNKTSFLIKSKPNALQF